MKRIGLIIFVCLYFSTVLFACAVKTNESVEINSKNLSNFFQKNYVVFSTVAVDVYTQIPIGTTFRLEKGIIEATNESGDIIGVSSLNMESDLQTKILRCLQLMEDYTQNSNKNCIEEINVGSFDLDEKKILNFSFRDVDEWRDYRIIYSPSNIDGLELSGNWYLQIDKLV